MSRWRFQVAVLGSGFAGSLTAMIAKRLGFDTILIERGRHPRFAIGESSTPLANLLLEELAADYDLPFLRPLSKWGTWQRALPEIGCGLKRGFTFYRHRLDETFQPDPLHERQLLVGASPNERVADTHWYRPDLDHYLVRQAERLGVAYWDETEVEHAMEGTSGMRLLAKRRGEPVSLGADFVIDATGPRGCLSRTLGLGEQDAPGALRTQALFSHFQNVDSLPDCFSSKDAPPYPPEQAAVHHVFGGGWVWVLKFNNGITSAGVVASDELANHLAFHSGEAGWVRFMKRLPSLEAIFNSASAVAPFVHLPRVAFRSAKIAGSRWVLLPSAAGFVDPLLSTGIPLTLLGIRRIGRVLRQMAESRANGAGEELQNYVEQTNLELDAASMLVESLYASMDRFELFRSLSLLYFAAASFSEAARRLGKPFLADSFLLCRNPEFFGNLRELCLRTPHAKTESAIIEVQRGVLGAIGPFDIAGLADPARNHWYPASTGDLVRNRHKLGATEEEITAMLRNCDPG